MSLEELMASLVRKRKNRQKLNGPEKKLQELLDRQDLAQAQPELRALEQEIVDEEIRQAEVLDKEAAARRAEENRIADERAKVDERLRQIGSADTEIQRQTIYQLMETEQISHSKATQIDAETRVFREQAALLPTEDGFSHRSLESIDTELKKLQSMVADTNPIHTELASIAKEAGDKQGEGFKKAFEAAKKSTGAITVPPEMEIELKKAYDLGPEKFKAAMDAADLRLQAMGAADKPMGLGGAWNAAKTWTLDGVLGGKEFKLVEELRNLEKPTAADVKKIAGARRLGNIKRGGAAGLGLLGAMLLMSGGGEAEEAGPSPRQQAAAEEAMAKLGLIQSKTMANQSRAQMNEANAMLKMMQLAQLAQDGGPGGAI